MKKAISANLQNSPNYKKDIVIRDCEKEHVFIDTAISGDRNLIKSSREDFTK